MRILRFSAKLFWVSALISVPILIFLYYALSPFPELKSFEKRNYSVQFYDRNERLIYVTALDGGLRREFIPYENIPEHVKKAFIKSEDRRFFFHQGIDLQAIFRATFQNIVGKRTVSGASTITMQLARLVYGEKERNLASKIKETDAAFRLEAKLSKKKILELYLNNLPFGNNVEGIESAAHYYFSKSARELSKEEAMLLSIIPRRPITYNPLSNPEIAGKKAAFVFSFSEKKLVQTAKNLGGKAYDWPFRFPHLVEKAKKEIPPFASRCDLSVNLDIQEFSKFCVNAKLSEAKESRINNAAAVVLENSTGKVLAWVGSNDWFDKWHSGQIDGVLSPNQMGSSMKPFLYAAALEKRKDSSPIFFPTSVLADVPMEFGGEKIYFPRNFNNRYNGPVLFRMALASSLNVPAVYILSRLSVPYYLDTLYSLGFESLKKSGKKADLGLALGAGEVSLLELASAFSVFPRDGIYIEPTYIEGTEGKKRKVFEPDTARIICDFLKDKSARATGFGYSQTFLTKYPSIFKTGTANQFQNIVAVGATPKYTVAVWMGNFSGNTVIGKTGSSLPAEAAKEILDFLTEDEKLDFKEPENFRKSKICSLSGMKPNEDCPTTLEEYVEISRERTIQSCNCDWHRRNSKGILTSHYPAEYQGWISKNHTNSFIEYSTSELKIASPANGSVFYIDKTDTKEQRIPVNVLGGISKKDELTVLYDGKELSENGKKTRILRPFAFSVPLEKGLHTLTVKLEDEEKSIIFEVK